MRIKRNIRSIPKIVSRYLNFLLGSLSSDDIYSRAISLNMDNLFEIEIDSKDSLKYGLDSVVISLSNDGNLKIEKLYVNTNYYHLSFENRVDMELEIILSNVLTKYPLYFFDYSCLPTDINIILQDLDFIFGPTCLTEPSFIRLFMKSYDCIFRFNDLFCTLNEHFSLDILDKNLLSLTNIMESNKIYIECFSLYITFNSDLKLYLGYQKLISLSYLKLFKGSNFKLLYTGLSVEKEVGNLFYYLDKLYTKSVLKKHCNYISFYYIDARKGKNYIVTQDYQILLDRFMKMYANIFKLVGFKKYSSYEIDIYLDKINEIRF